MKSSFLLLFIVLVTRSLAQDPGTPASAPNIHPASQEYEWPTDSLVRKKLDEWQDQKFGIILHWGLYAVPGMIESWALCSEDWIERDSTMSYDSFKQWYWGLKDRFNPVNFDPGSWAKAAKDAGMKYMVFTTKHHDGFNMFDTKQSDFKISAGPFAGNPRANVAREVFAAFRSEGFLIGAYFSKPDWHSEYYWWPKYATANRNNNYDIRKYPWRWNKYKEFTHAQLGELMHDYGSIDILWLDGGWVRPRNTVNAEVLSWGAPIPDWSQDIDMPGIAAMARKAQPGILFVDRTVHGPYENYQTPEQSIPAKQPDHPWESCMTLGGAWGFVANDQLKSARQVIRTLIEVTAKGGSLLLGVGPKPDGRLTPESVSRLKEIGDWLKLNGAAIYGTRTTKEYQEDGTWFTAAKDGGRRYALHCMPDAVVDSSSTANLVSVPGTLTWKINLPRSGSVMKEVSTGTILNWSVNDGICMVRLPGSLRKRLAGTPAVAISFVPR